MTRFRPYRYLLREMDTFPASFRYPVQVVQFNTEAFP
jgi:hypothetical protein